MEFDTLDIFSDEGRRLLRAGFVFAMIRFLKPSLSDGDADAAWLETTYLSDQVRLGRGNKVVFLANCTPNVVLDQPLSHCIF